MTFRLAIVLQLMIFIVTDHCAQKRTSFFEPADSLDHVRFYTALGLGVTSYTATTIGLYHTWYSQFEQTGFHFFDDRGEWENMDKLGHTYTAYNLANIGYQGARWTGLSKKGSLWTAGIGSSVVQLAIEVMDGFSAKWGFSNSDLGYNLAGTGVFLVQQQFWDEQKIRIKMFSFPKSYDGIQPYTDRINDLFGQSYSERFLKDYNAQSLWVSANIKSFFPNSRSPKWLNIAIGYSAENLYGGFDNNWEIDGEVFFGDNELYPRYHQWLLALDIDLDRLKPKSYFWQMWLSLLNSFKMPSPAIEYNSLGEWKFHLIFKN